MPSLTKNEATRLRNLQEKKSAGKTLKPLDYYFLNKLTVKQEPIAGSTANPRRPSGCR